MTAPHTEASRIPAWLNHVRPLKHEKLRLFCFPFAGGSTSIFESWRGFTPFVHVEFPGRASRFGEMPHRRLGPLVEEMAQALAPFLDVPLAFFGDSMGSLVAFELARWIEKANCIGPRCLHLSATRPPQLAEPPRRLRYDLPEAEFRADLEVSQTYRYSPGILLKCPISVFLGTEDTDASPNDGSLWQELTYGRFSFAHDRWGSLLYPQLTKGTFECARP